MRPAALLLLVLVSSSWLAACDGGEPPADDPAPATLARPASVTTTTSVDESGRALRVTTFEAPATAPAALAAQRAACERDDHEACAALATSLLNAGGNAEAEEVWYQSCLAGHGPSCAELGYQYNNPFIHLAHPERALDVLTRGCEAPTHPPIACASLAERYAPDARTRFGTEPDPARRRALLERACQDGHYWSCTEIGRPPPSPP